MANMSKKTQKRISRFRSFLHQTYGGYGRTEQFDIYERMLPERIRIQHDAWVDSRYVHRKHNCIKYRSYLRYQ